MNQAPTPVKKNHKWAVIIIVLLIAGYFIFFGLSFFGPLIATWRLNNKADNDFDKIMKMIEPAAEREYQFHEPSKEALNRKIDCRNLSMFQGKLPIVNPLCLNLYKTTPEEINKKLSANDNQFDRVILYGEKIIWDAAAAKNSGMDYGKALVESAKFNDQITIPVMMKLYGFNELGFVNKLAPDKIFPFPALYFRLSNNEEIQKSCQKTDNGEEQMAGCALGMWSSIIPDYILGEKISLANQKVWRIGNEKDRGFVAYDYKWPKNCYTEGTMLHETAHLFLNAHRVFNITDALVSPRYFNEHQADTAKIMATDLVCGEGSVTNFRDEKKNPTTLAQFNSSYPPGKMGSAWPKTDEGCKMGLLNEWNRFLAKGKFNTQFTVFSSSLKDWMKEGKTISDDRGLANFLIKLNNDDETRTNLQYRGCYF